MHHPTNPTAPDSSASHRTADGKFAFGNPGGRGNPFARRTAELRQLFWSDCTPETLQEIIAAIRQKAIKGDLAAAKLYLSYTIGKPEKPTDAGPLPMREAVSLLNQQPVWEELEEKLNTWLMTVHAEARAASEPAACRQQTDSNGDPAASQPDRTLPATRHHTDFKGEEASLHNAEALPEQAEIGRKSRKRKGRLSKPMKYPSRHQTEIRHRVGDPPALSGREAHKQMLTGSLAR